MSGLIILGIILVIRYLIWPFLFEVFHPRFGQETTHEKITTEDMVLHDMMNEDDQWDIGTIDFNE